MQYLCDRFVFCYPCIYDYIKQHQCCPVTSYPSRQEHLIKLYPPDSWSRIFVSFTIEIQCCDPCGIQVLQTILLSCDTKNPQNCVVIDIFLLRDKRKHIYLHVWEWNCNYHNVPMCKTFLDMWKELKLILILIW